MKKTRKVYWDEIKELFKKHKENWKELKWISNALNLPYDTIKRWSSKVNQGKTLKDWRKSNRTKQKKFSDEDLKNYVNNNENATLKEIWKNFSVTGVAIYYRLKIMKYSYKKKRWDIKKEIKKKEKSLKKS